MAQARVMITGDATFGSAEGRVEAHTLFAQTMGLVAVTTGFFAGGAYLGRNLSSGWGLMWFIAALACLLAMDVVVRKSEQLAVAILFAFGVVMGLAMAPTLAYYANANPDAVWQAGAATALFIGGFGAAGYATRRDLSALARVSSWALVGLIVFGIVLIFTNIPGGSRVYSVLGLVVFAGLTMADFQRLRAANEGASAPLLAVSIFLDILNVFQFFLSLFGRRR
jgi:uncharacterized protein